MSALTLLRNFDRDFSRPFWMSDLAPFYSERKEGLPEFKSDSAWDDESKTWTLTIEASGVVKENLKLDIKENHLVVQAEKTKGITKGKLEQAFVLPKNTDIEKIEALFEDGILTVKLPQTEKRVLKSIEIK